MTTCEYAVFIAIDRTTGVFAFYTFQLCKRDETIQIRPRLALGASLFVYQLFGLCIFIFFSDQFVKRLTFKFAECFLRFLYLFFSIFIVVEKIVHISIINGGLISGIKWCIVDRDKSCV